MSDKEQASGFVGGRTIKVKLSEKQCYLLLSFMKFKKFVEADDAIRLLIDGMEQWLTHRNIPIVTRSSQPVVVKEDTQIQAKNTLPVQENEPLNDVDEINY